MRVKVLRGSFTLAVGSPTVYFGHSDVRSAPRTLKPTDDWQTVEFSLHHDIGRNFRRARFGATSPVIYYTRWIQEPLYFCLIKDSSGELLIDQIELIAKGEGRPYPTFAREQITPVSRIADFEDPADMAKAFTCMQDSVDRTGEPRLTRPVWAPPTLERVRDDARQTWSLRSDKVAAEEVCFTGVQARGTDKANAIALTLKADHTQAIDPVVLDFIVYVTTPARTAEFPWASLKPPQAWVGSPLAFTYYMAQPDLAGQSVGFYHVRRAFAKGKWTTAILPLDDFICAWGEGECRPMFQQQQPLKAESIIAVAWCPSYRQRSGTTQVMIDELSFVKVPGAAAQLRSFPQVADVTRVRLVKDPTVKAAGGVAWMQEAPTSRPAR